MTTWHPAPTHARPVTAGQALVDIHVAPWDRDFQDIKMGRAMLPVAPGAAYPTGRRKTFANYQKLHPDQPCHTLTAFGYPIMYWHWTHRPLRLPEWAALHGYSRSFRWPSSETRAAHMIGNSVPPPLAEAVGRAVANLLRGA